MVDEQQPPGESTTRLQRVNVERIVRCAIVITIAGLRILLDAVAGKAAAKAGVWMEGTTDRELAIQIGFKLGAFHSALAYFRTFVGLVAPLNLAQSMLLVLPMSGFGMAALLGTWASKVTFDEVHTGMIVASLFVRVVKYADVEFRLGRLMVRPNAPGANSLAGLVFVTVAHRWGFYICKRRTGIYAGFIYGTAIFVLDFIASLAQYLLDALYLVWKGQGLPPFIEYIQSTKSTHAGSGYAMHSATHFSSLSNFRHDHLE